MTFEPRPGRATNILVDRLDKLEGTALLKSALMKSCEIKTVFRYAKGRRSLGGLRYDPQSPASEEFIAAASKDKKKAVRDMTRAIGYRKFAAYRSLEMGIDL